MTSLRSKLFLLQATAAAVIVVSLLVLIKVDLYPAIVSMEREDAKTVAAQFHQELSHETDALGHIVTDWAHWNEAYEFVKTKNPGFIDDNITQDFFDTSGISYISIYGLDGSNIYSHGIDAFDAADFSKFAIERHVLSLHRSEARHSPLSWSGVIAFAGDIYIYTAASITNSNVSVPPNGILVMARRIDDAFIQDISSRMHAPIELIGPNHLYAHMDATNTAVKRNGVSMLDVPTRIYDDVGEIIGIAHILMKRTAYDIGVASIYFTSTALLLSLAVSLGALLFFSSHIVTSPLRRLAQAVGLMGKESILLDELVDRGDEIGVVARAITSMHHRAIYLANHDPLTSLPNRKIFEEAFSVAVDGTAEKTGKSFGLFVLDLDGFKQINDTHGHGAGDEVLRVIGGRIREILRDGDLVARMGGDEFAILCERLRTPEDISAVARKLIEICAADIPLEDGSSVHVGASIGAIVVSGKHEKGAVYALADRALYESKRSGKNRFTVSSA